MILRIPVLALAGLLALSGAARAHMEPGLARWQQPDGIVAEESDPLAPFVTFFTPIYSDAAQAASWSMMAARWRDSGRIDLSVGLRLVHAGEPQGIVGASIVGASDGRDDLAIDTFRPIRTCDESGLCIQRETASIALPVPALRDAAAEGMQIRITTAHGPDRLLTFPAEILAQLYRQASAEGGPR